MIVLSYEASEQRYGTIVHRHDVIERRDGMIALNYEAFAQRYGKIVYKYRTSVHNYFALKMFAFSSSGI